MNLYDLYIATIGELNEYESGAPEHEIARRIKQLEAEKSKAIKIAKEFHSYIESSGPREWSEINQLWQRLKALEDKDG